jgi:hypothetical protein
MSAGQSEAARRRHAREASEDEICPECKGSGRIRGKTVRTRARKGGNASYMKSRETGQLSMSERGRLGGAPSLPTLAQAGAQSPQSPQSPQREE